VKHKSNFVEVTAIFRDLTSLCLVEIYGGFGVACFLRFRRYISSRLLVLTSQ